MRFRKKFILTAVVVAMLFTFVPVINVYAAPVESSYPSDANYYYHTGYFYWFGNNSSTYETGESWYSAKPRKPNTFYSDTWGDIQYDGYYENNGYATFGFTSYDAVWADGSSKAPSWNSIYRRYEKRVIAYYRRTKTSPYYVGASINGAQYVNGSDYWIKPGTTLNVNIHGRQDFDGYVQQLDDFVYYNYLRLTGNGQDIRAAAQYNGALNYFMPNTNEVNIGLPSVWRDNGNRDLYTTFSVRPSQDLRDFIVEAYEYSANGKYGPGDSYVSTGLAIRTDGTAPTLSATPSSNGWTNNVSVKISANDTRSGVNTIYYVWSNTNTNVPTAWNSINSSSVNIAQNNEGTWYLWYYATDNVGNKSNPVCSGPYKVDKKVPTSTGLTITNGSDINKYIITAKNVTDNLSGVNDGTIRVAGWKDGEAYRNWYTMSRVSGTNDFTVTVDLNTSSHTGKYGTFDAHVYGSDNAGNDGFITGTSFNRIMPNPMAGRLTVYEYDYKESDSVYWVKPSSTIGIYTDGYFPSSYGIYPSRAYLLFAKDGIISGNSARQYGDVNGSYIYGSEYNTYFTLNDSKEKAQQFQYSGNNYLGIRHHMKAKLDGTAFKLMYANTYLSGGIEYYDKYYDSGIWLKTDGIAPGCTDTSNKIIDSKLSTIINLDENLNINARVDYLKDIGSGINSVYAKIYPSGREAEAKILQLNLVNGSYILSNANVNNLFSSEDINIDIYSRDNVGNIGKIKAQRFDLFTLNSYIVPYNAPSFQGIPTLEKGQKAILKIYTTGFADKLQITFPYELTALDSTLSKTINIGVNGSLTTEIVFNVPQYVEEKNNYAVNVKALKNSIRIGEDNAEFNVTGNILKGIRTRTKYN
jgi:hypothetical protein